MTHTHLQSTQTSTLARKKGLFSGSFLSGLSQFGARFGRDERGVAAIEFSLIAPLMLTIYFGLLEVSLLIEADRNVTQAASLIGDLAAQEDTLTTSMMENYINAAVAILGTNEALSRDKIGVEITSFEAVADSTASDGRAINEIGYATYGLPYDGGTITIPATGSTAETTVSEHYDASGISDVLLPAGSGIIIARLNYSYTSPLNFFVKDTMLRETFFLKPRRSTTVAFDNGNASDPSNMKCSMSAGSNVSFTCSPTSSS